MEVAGASPLPLGTKGLAAFFRSPCRCSARSVPPSTAKALAWVLTSLPAPVQLGQLSLNSVSSSPSPNSDSMRDG